jgi:hypothetical protein
MVKGGINLLEDPKASNERLINIIRAKLLECENPEDFLDLLYYADDFLEYEDENGNELNEPMQIRQKIFYKYIEAVQRHSKMASL